MSSTSLIERSVQDVRLVVRHRSALVITLAFTSIIISVLAQDWIAGLGLIVLWAIWHFLPADGPPVLALALTFQWVQINLAIYVYALTGFRVPEMDNCDYRPFVLISLGCLVALIIGLRIGIRIARREKNLSPDHEFLEVFTWRDLPVIYVGSIFFAGILHGIAWQIPQLTQPMLSLGMIRYGLLFLVFRKLLQTPRRALWIPFILAVEIVLGFTGFFADFREAQIMAVLALLEKFNPRQFLHWAYIAVLALVITVSGLLWTGIKNTFRQEFNAGLSAESQDVRAERAAELASEWFSREVDDNTADMSAMVSRLWAVYYPSLAYSRVPADVPHEDGAIEWAAIQHILTPRLIFPEKEEMVSDSEKVRKYSGEQVAGEEQGVSIAFGYVGESYVDFGVPLMFLPPLIFAVLVGMAYQALIQLIKHREISIALVTLIFWLSLYLFERSWLVMLGLTGTLIFYVGGAAYLVDRALLMRRSFR